jgi:hypothetical protein
VLSIVQRNVERYPTLSSDDILDELETMDEQEQRQRATRQLLGETYAVNGDVASAVAFWRTADLGQDQLQPRAFWYQYSG